MRINTGTTIFLHDTEIQAIHRNLKTTPKSGKCQSWLIFAQFHNIFRDSENEISLAKHIWTQTLFFSINQYPPVPVSLLSSIKFPIQTKYHTKNSTVFYLYNSYNSNWHQNQLCTSDKKYINRLAQHPFPSSRTSR